MLRLFKHSSLFQMMLIILVTAIFWLRAFVSPQPIHPDYCFSPLFDLLQGVLSPHPVLSTAIALVLLILEAVWFCIILSSHKLNKANWLMPTLLFILAMSCGPEHLNLTPILLANIAILAALSQLLSSGNTTLEVGQVFNAAFCIGLAILCHLPLIVFIVSLLLVFVTYKLYRWREIIVAILGLTAPALLLIVYVFLVDKLDYCLILIRHDIVNLHFSINTTNTVVSVTNIIFILVVFVSLCSQLSSLGDKTIQQRINTIILIIPVVSTLLLLPYSNIFPVDTRYAALPFAFATSNFLATDRKRPWINEIFFWIILLTPLFLTFFGS